MVVWLAVTPTLMNRTVRKSRATLPLSEEDGEIQRRFFDERRLDHYRKSVYQVVVPFFSETENLFDEGITSRGSREKHFSVPDVIGSQNEPVSLASNRFHALNGHIRARYVRLLDERPLETDVFDEDFVIFLVRRFHSRVVRGERFHRGREIHSPRERIDDVNHPIFALSPYPSGHEGRVIGGIAFRNREIHSRHERPRVGDSRFLVLYPPVPNDRPE